MRTTNILKTRRLINLAIAILLMPGLLSISSCKKFLDEPSSKKLVVPESLKDLQALLDGISGTGTTGTTLGAALSDDYYISYTSWQTIKSSFSPTQSNDALHYVWDGAAISLDDYWRFPYTGVYYSNVVLDKLPDIQITDGNRQEWNNIRGSALFYRAFSFWSIAQLYCKPYNSSTGSTDLGIPIRLDPNLEIQSVRTSVQVTYDQIVRDLITASNILPETQIVLTRPNKTAAYAALARIYLSMRDYTQALYYSDLTLANNGALMNYNSLNALSSKPIPLFNAEVVYHEKTSVLPFTLDQSVMFVDSTLYQSYDNNDLRKKIFFKPNGNGGYNFQGSYSEYATSIFDGIATDEMYLTRAECNARAGNKNAALMDLNTLLRQRWKTGTFTDISANSANDALDTILIERRKELCFRTLRWSDLRRLNFEGRNISLKRNLNGVIYNLPANDLRWVVLIPQDVINYSGIQQNPR